MNRLSPRSNSSLPLPSMPSPPKASRNADLSRLLDPSYSSSAFSTSSSVYVDHSGEYHDPDYRPFPIRPTQSKARSYSRSSQLMRPQWELGIFNSGYAYDDDENENGDTDSMDRRSFQDDAPQRSTSLSRSKRASPSLSSSPLPPTPFTPPLSHGWSASTTSDSVLSSVESPFADFAEDEKGERKEKKVATKKIKKLRRSSASKSAPVLEEHDDEGYFSDSPHATSSPSLTMSRTRTTHQSFDLNREYSRDPLSSSCPDIHDSHGFGMGGDREKFGETPTCGYALRREWTAFKLRFWFGIGDLKRKFNGG